MGVIYKLRDDVVHFIISQRQSNPLSSCRQLAESASQKFGLHLSKSSVHDVLKESGIVTPRGRKPKDKFKIPQEKKKQIHASLSQVKLLAPPSEPPAPSVNEGPIEKEDVEISSEYEGAGRIFFKAALWDLGIYSEEKIKETDWKYYLTYSKGIKVVLENDKDFFIDLPLPVERCVREAADGLINNVVPLIVDKVSDEDLFKACMEHQEGLKIRNIEIVGQNDHVLFEFSNIMELERRYLLKNRVFVENHENNAMQRSKSVFFPQDIENNNVIDNILDLKGFNTTNKSENTVTLLIAYAYDNKMVLQEAAERLNGMYLRDEQDRLVKVKIETADLAV
jgi:hypothetical protein